MAYFDAHPAEAPSTGRSASSPVPPPTPKNHHRRSAVPQPTPFANYAALHHDSAEPAAVPQQAAPSPYRGRQTWRRKSPLIGFAGMLVAVTANLLMAIGFLPMVPVLRTAIDMARVGDQLSASQIAGMVDAAAIGTTLQIAFWLGAAGLLLGIVAAVANRGRGWGAVTILLSIIGPIVVSLFWVALAFN